MNAGLQHNGLYWPTRLYIAMIRAENAQRRAEEAANAPPEPERWWVRLLRWLGVRK